MTLEYLTRPCRSESEARAQWREKFIQRQIAGLRAAGLSESELEREIILLRGGFTVTDIFTAGRPIL